MTNPTIKTVRKVEDFLKKNTGAHTPSKIRYYHQEIDYTSMVAALTYLTEIKKAEIVKGADNIIRYRWKR